MSTCAPSPPNAETPYRGRFAPSPTGPLHFGSLVTALAGFLQARSHVGRWLLRIDDIDPPREQPGAADAIRTVLARCHLEWDEEVTFQRHSLEDHRAACEKLMHAGLAYRCTCSRKLIGARAYPGTCREAKHLAQGRHSVRVRVGADRVSLEDPVQGRQTWNLEQEGGDFVIWRVEDLPAYHLAAVVDDAAAGITEIVRGADLLDSAPRQRHLQTLLDLPRPAYLHLPVAVDAAGQKLSKQKLAPAISESSAAEALVAALNWLGQTPPTVLQRAPPAAIIEWAIAHWDPRAIPRQRQWPAPHLGS
ncbi:MAG: tRNA glutamyl-Q(34) synthetase GluQRS [Gammaproteobacteria bacterium]|nr:tRNA glutamyl-Q(34) synthetase GluQRS [Gammaproteobacteria bacterium]